MTIIALFLVGIRDAFFDKSSDRAIVALLFSLAPLWGALMGKLLLGEELRIHTMTALVVSLGALLLCIMPEIFHLESLDHLDQDRASLGHAATLACGTTT